MKKEERRIKNKERGRKFTSQATIAISARKAIGMPFLSKCLHDLVSDDITTFCTSKRGIIMLCAINLFFVEKEVGSF